MSLIPWRTKHQDEPTGQIAPVGAFRWDVDRLFDSFFRDAFHRGDRAWGEVGTWALPLDVAETDKEIHVRAEIPGVKADDLQVSISGNALVISGEKKESQERKEGGYTYQERHFGSFRREIPLPTAVDDGDVQAEYKDGVLEVTLKKSQEALPKRIPVKSN